jgi:PAS domain S-box-containing protein
MSIKTAHPKSPKTANESADFFRYLFESHPIPMWIYELKTLAFLEVNDAAVEKYGYRRDEFLSLTLKDIRPAEDVVRLLKDAKQKRPSLQHAGEWRHRLKDGRIINVEITSHTIEFNGRKAVLVTAQDITERKQAEALLRESEKQYRFSQGILRSASDGILVVNRENEVLYANERFAEMWMIPREVVTKKDDTLLLQYVLDQLSDPQGFLQKVQELYHSAEESFDTLYFKDGRVFDRLSRPMLQETKLLGRVWSFRDITERKQAEEALRVLSTRQEAILAAVPDILMEVNKDKVYAWANPAGVGFFGEDVIGKEAAFYFEGEQDTYGMVKPLFNGNEDVIYVESWQRRKDGEKRLLGWWCRVLKDADGNVTGALSSAHDITERKRAEEEILQLNAELETRVEEQTRELREAQEQLVRKETLAVLGQLAGGVGHELRDPLAIIVNAVYFLKLIQPEAGGKIKEYLGLIERETHNAEKIISDLLNFARVKSADREAVSVSYLISQTLERFPASSSVEVTLDTPTDLPQVFADPRQMEQVLGNLVVNACQAMTNGGKLVISAKPSTVNGQPSVAIAIKDTGVGIPPENMRKLFEPLFTTKAKGIGLGLAVSRKLAEANGGRIEVQSEAGVGSMFTLWLPVQANKQ